VQAQKVSFSFSAFHHKSLAFLSKCEAAIEQLSSEQAAMHMHQRELSPAL
jgi:uncharacterized membrane protein (DUF106 family)